MNKNLIIFPIITFVIGMASMTLINSKKNLNNEIKISQLDSIIISKDVQINSQLDTIDFYKTKYNYANAELNYIIDSLKTYNALDYKAEIDSLRSDLFVANYKLGRIKEYCNIVAKNSTQLKYLRGWINRVLED